MLNTAHNVWKIYIRRYDVVVSAKIDVRSCLFGALGKAVRKRTRLALTLALKNDERCSVPRSPVSGNRTNSAVFDLTPGSCRILRF